VHHAYGLLLIRQRRYAEATEHLGHATRLQPDSSRYSYVYAIALQEIGETKGALSVLGTAHDRHPNDREILFALATMSRDSGDLDSAVGYAEALVKLSPTQPDALRLLESLLTAKP
jgi:Flp pilus assembly protein TadD